MFKIAKGYTTVSKIIRLPEDTVNLLESLAGENNISLNQLINQCIQFSLSQLNPTEHTKNTEQQH